MIAHAQPAAAAAESKWRERVEGSLVFFGAFALVALTAGSTGGYRPTTWGWTAVITLWSAILGLVVRRRFELAIPALVFMGALIAFTGWIALSNIWTPSVTSTMLEVQRAIAYVGIVGSTLLLVKRSSVPQLLGGTLTGVALISLYSLGTRVLPDRVTDFNSIAGDYRLSAPITYWNALGLFAVIGTFLALGFAARGRIATRALSAASVAVFLPTVYFTFSRGAWVALAIGTLVVLAVDAKRVQLLALYLAMSPFAVIAVVASSSKDGLTHRGASFDQAVSDGHALVLVLVAAATGLAFSAAVFGLLERRTRVPRIARRAFVVALAIVVTASLGVVWSREGSPVVLMERTWNGFQAPPNATTNDVSQRLFQLSSNGRLGLWETAWAQFKATPLVGNGAGSFWQVWGREEARGFNALDAHSLYAETLGELGIAGLALLGTALVVVMVVGVQVRREPYAAAALGAFAAWAAHAGVDWQWEFVGVTGAAMLCASALLISSTDVRLSWANALAWRVPLAVLFAGASLFASAGLLSAASIDRGIVALGEGDSGAARSAVRNAKRWAPWSSEVLQVAALVDKREGRFDDARQTLIEATRKDPDNWTLWVDLAILSRGSSRAEALEKARRLNPRSTPAQLPPPPT